MRGVLKAVVGIVLPLLLIVLLVSSLGPRPEEPPPPVALPETPAASGEHAVELVGGRDGEWEVTGGFVGYRVVEHYPRLRGPHEGVGRTDTVRGRALVVDDRLEEVTVRADLRGLESPEESRDDATRVRYLEADEHPWAEFVLDTPVALEPAPAPGEPFELTVEGELTIRDVTRTVAVPLRARWDGEGARVVGQLPISLSEWGVRVPDIPGFVRVEDEAVMELDLSLTRR